jgi:hypothetical protein
VRWNGCSVGARAWIRRSQVPVSGDGQDDELAGLEECRLAVEQVVMPQGRPVELLPRSERVRRMQADLVERYRLRSDVFGQAEQCRLRVFPPDQATVD